MAALPDRVVLVGLPGSGKTTTGPILARKLGWRFVDLDQAIEAETGLAVQEIFAQYGEAEFRRLERKLTAQLASEPQLVLAAGGGWVVQNQLADALLVWLQVDPSIANFRVSEGGDVRPLLQPDPLERLTELLVERKSLYQRADIYIDTNDKTPEATALAIAAAIEDRRYGN